MTETFTQGTVGGYLHRPDEPTGDGIVLTHGAGSNCQAPVLVGVARELENAGMIVLRCDLPFRQARPGGPPRPGDAARDREGLCEAVTAMRGLASGRVYVGGHSYGGRQASMLAADDAELVAGLLLLSYPLHPPRRPDELRTAHFPKLVIPAVFVHGSRDAFGSFEEMRRALALIQAPTELVEIEGAGHDLKSSGAGSLAVRHFTAFLFTRGIIFG